MWRCKRKIHAFEKPPAEPGAVDMLNSRTPPERRAVSGGAADSELSGDRATFRGAAVELFQAAFLMPCSHEYGAVEASFVDVYDLKAPGRADDEVTGVGVVEARAQIGQLLPKLADLAREAFCQRPCVPCLAF